jgi:DNA-directed RNA polymerase subunit RPC12/RpoP
MESVGENNNSAQNQKGVPLDLVKRAEYIECENCGGTIFQEKMMIKQISKFMTGSNQDSIVPMPVIACAKCSHVNELFKPQI